MKPAPAATEKAAMPTSTVHLEIPASGAYLSVARAAATGLAAQLQFTYEEIDDLRIAVDEACTQLRVDVSIEAPDRGDPLAKDTFAWQILTAITDEVSEQAESDRLALSFRKVGGRA